MNMENLMSGAFGALFVTVFDFVLLRKQNKLEDRLNLVEDEKSPNWNARSINIWKPIAARKY